jgi:hypothetical protein
MMKRMVLFAVLGMFVLSNNLSAMDTLRTHLVGFGESIENVNNIPLIDKLTNLLPFAMVAACFKECPGQTMMVLTGLLFYVISKNESVRSVFNKYKSMGLARFGIAQKKEFDFDDTLFIFDGEDAEDAEEEMDMEDELLEMSLFNDEYSKDEYSDVFKDKKSVEQPKFL